MSVSSGITAAADLSSAIRGSLEPGSTVTALKVQVQGNALVLADSKHSSAGSSAHLDEAANYSLLSGVIDPKEAAYVLLRVKNGFVFVTWVPDNHVRIRERMVYASSASALKTAVGYSNVVDTQHFTNLDDILQRAGKSSANSAGTTGTPKVNDASYTKDRFDVRSVMSRDEIIKMELQREEEVERKERADRVARQLNAFAPPPSSSSLQSAVSAAAATATSAATSNKSMAAAMTGGGFHAFNVSLNSEASRAVRDAVEDGHNNWVELALSPSGNSLELANSSHISRESTSIIPLPSDEPRFGVLVIPNDGSSFGNNRILVYSCPSSSRPKLRMTYSSAVSGVLTAIVKETNAPFHFRFNVFDHANGLSISTIIVKIRNESECVVKLENSTKSFADIVTFDPIAAQAKAMQAAGRVANSPFRKIEQLQENEQASSAYRSPTASSTYSSAGRIASSSSVAAAEPSSEFKPDWSTFDNMPKPVTKRPVNVMQGHPVFGQMAAAMKQAASIANRDPNAPTIVTAGSGRKGIIVPPSYAY